MRLKKCARCGKVQPFTNFCKDSRLKDGLRSACKECRSTESLKSRRTKKGLIREIYNGQCSSSKKRGHIAPSYTKQELKEWLYSQDKFHVLYNEWKISGYKKDKIPSVDRRDESIGYTMSNIQLMTWEENRIKSYENGYTGKVVIQECYGLEVKFRSAHEAQRIIGIKHQNITAVCRGERKTAGGFKWRYEDAS